MIHLLTVIALLATPTTDADLQARFQLAAVPGVTFRLAVGAPLEPQRICAGKHASCINPERRYDINWASGPERVTPIALSANVLAGSRVLLRAENGVPLLVARGNTVMVALDTRDAVRRWPYFNYLLHAAACDVAGQPAPAFADWKNSPMPQGGVRRLFAFGAAAAWVLVLLLFRLARRRGRARPEAASEFFLAADISGRAIGTKRSGGANWSRVGFARPLAGLLTLIGTMFFITGAFLALQWLIGSRFQPFPEADGLWKSVFDMLWVIWMLFDLGTQTAFVKYFAEHRVAKPAEALADVQFYVWWQIFARLLQSTALCAIGVGYLPRSEYAIYAPFVALYSTITLPSVYPFGKLLCQALQRFDYANLLELVELRVMPFVVPIPFVLLARKWGLHHPVYGEAFGAAVGLGIGQLASNLVTLGMGVGVLNRLRIPLGPVFLAQFTREVAKRQLLYGIKVTMVQEPIKFIQSFENIIIIKLLHDFTAWQGIRDLLCNRLQVLFFFAWTYYMSGIPAFSEAFSAGKKKLTQYYFARYFQFGTIFNVTLFSLMVAVGPSFIAALGPQWARASPYLVLAMLLGLIGPLAWLSDALQMGTGHPWTCVMVTAVEQVVRLSLFMLIVPRFGFVGILVGTTGAVLVKVLLAWAVNHWTIIRLRFSLWTTVVATGIAGLVNYLVLRGVVSAWAPSSIVSMLVLFSVASAMSFFVCFFVCGLAGGYDYAALEELAEAAQMTTLLLRPVCNALASVARFGARFAPYTPRPLDIIEEARKEAAELDLAAQVSLGGKASARVNVISHG